MAGATAGSGTAAGTAPATADQTSSTSSTAKQNEAMWVAAIVLGLYVVFVTVLVFMRSDANWDRLVYLLGGFEAIVFAAVGWIFGTTVSRGQVKAAEETKDEAKQQAATARADAAAARQAESSARDGLLVASKDAERGKALAARLKSIGASVVAGTEPRPGPPPPPPPAPAEERADADGAGDLPLDVPPVGDREMPAFAERGAPPPGPPPAPTRSELGELVDLAHRLFPDD